MFFPVSLLMVVFPWITFLTVFLFWNGSYGKVMPVPQPENEIHCTHLQVCRLITRVQRDFKEDLKTMSGPQLIIFSDGDPHHYSPTPEVIKALRKAPILATPHLSLWSWGRKILEKRLKKGLKTLELSLSPLSKHHRLTTEEGAHFWLSIMAYCNSYKEMVSYIKSLYPEKNDWSSSLCPYQNLAKRLENVFDKIQIPFILNHNALVPLMKEYGVPHFSLRTSGHHSKISPRDLKNVVQFLSQHKQVYWVWESQIETPSSIWKMKRKDDRSLKLNTLGKPNDAKGPLEIFLELLEKDASSHYDKISH